MLNFLIDKNSYFILGILIGCLNIFFYNNLILSLILIFLQLSIMLYLFIKKEPLYYLLYLILFVSISLEFDVFINEKIWFGLLKLELFNIRFVILLIFPILFLLYPFKNKLIREIKKNDITYRFFKLISLCYIFAISMGLLNIITNNNNVSILPGFLLSFFKLSYFYGFTIFLIFIIISVMILNIKNIKIFKKYIIYILEVLSFISVFSLLCVSGGQYGDFSYLLISSCSFFIPLLILLPFYKDENKIPKIFICCGLLSLIIISLFGTSGKGLIIVGLIPIILICTLHRSKKQKFIFLCILVLIIISSAVIIKNLPLPHTIFNDKMDQVVSLFEINRPDYLNSLPLSPRTRLIELIGITNEYINTPIQIILGKGFLGTFKDPIGILASVTEGFSIAENSAGLYYLPHESFSRFYLMNGLFGLYTFFWLTKLCLKKIAISPWLLTGYIWFIFFYGYSISLSFLGIPILIIGMLDIDKKFNRQYDILVLDFLFENGHRYFCNQFVNALNKNTSTLTLSSKNYYDFNEDDMHKKIIIKNKKVPASNFIENRINILLNMFCSFRTIKKYRFNKVLIFGYENITFSIFRPMIKKYGDIFLVQHHQLDELNTSHLKKLFFLTYKRKVKHIVLEPIIKSSISKQYKIENENIFIFPVPLLNMNQMNKSKFMNYSSKCKLILAISNSNDESLIKDIYNYEKNTNFFEKHKLLLIIKTKNSYDDLVSINFIHDFISADDYNSLYNQAYIILIPFPKGYINRSSGTIIDAISMKKKLLCNRLLITEYYAKHFPHLCKVYDSVEELVHNLISFDDGFDFDEYNEFISEHDQNYQSKCAKLIVKG